MHRKDEKETGEGVNKRAKKAHPIVSQVINEKTLETIQEERGFPKDKTKRISAPEGLRDFFKHL